MTEIGSGLFMPIEATDMVGSGSCGLPSPFREVRVADLEGNTVPVGEIGELVVRGPGILQGYYNKPEATTAAFHGDWFRTGDLFRQDERGYFYIVGRVKEMIRRAGENISAREVEAVLCTPARHRRGGGRAGARRDARRGGQGLHRAAAGAEPRDASRPSASSRIARPSLARFKVPRYVEYRERAAEDGVGQDREASADERCRSARRLLRSRRRALAVSAAPTAHAPPLSGLRVLELGRSAGTGVLRQAAGRDGARRRHGRAARRTCAARGGAARELRLGRDGERALPLSRRRQAQHRRSTVRTRPMRRLSRSWSPPPISSFTTCPSSAARAQGIAFDDLRALQPGIVVAAITPYGGSGPYADLPASDLTVYALSGHLYLTGSPDREPLLPYGHQPALFGWRARRHDGACRACCARGATAFARLSRSRSRRRWRARSTPPSIASPIPARRAAATAIGSRSARRSPTSIGRRTATS